MTIADRIAVAGVSFVAALATWAVFVLLGDFSIILASGHWAVAAAGIAALVGFIVGPVRAAEWWGVIWGTEDAEKHRGFSAAVALAVIVVCLWSLLR